jgi:chromosome partitioning protein
MNSANIKGINCINDINRISYLYNFMIAKIIAFTNQKGGSGKTTLCMQMAGAIARREKQVLVVDADSQRTASRWAASAEADHPFPASVIQLENSHPTVHQTVQPFLESYQYILIDCPPAADSPIPQSALLIADLALVPIIPSPLDVWAAIGIRHVITNATRTNQTLKARLVLNQCQPNTTLIQETLQVLPEFGITLTKSKIQQRQVYRQSAVFGQTVHDFGSKASAAIREVEALTKEIYKLLA